MEPYQSEWWGQGRIGCGNALPSGLRTEVTVHVGIGTCQKILTHSQTMPIQRESMIGCSFPEARERGFRPFPGGLIPRKLFFCMEL